MKKFCVVLDEEFLRKSQESSLRFGNIDPKDIFNTSKFLRELLKQNLTKK